VVAFVLGVSNSFEMPAAAALVPELVPKEHLAIAIAIDRSVFHGTRLIGPALAGYVIGLGGSAAAFFVNALSFVALMLALVGIRPRAQGSAAEQAQRRTGIKEGVAYVRSDKATLGMIGMMAATTAFVFPVVVVMMPLYARNVLGLGPDKMGLLMAISGIGSLGGSVSLLAVPGNKRCGLMLAAVIGAAAALTSLSQARAFAFAAASQVVLSLAISTLLGLANIVVQERAPGPLRGRVSAVAGLSFFGLMPFASLGLTTVADWIGMRVVLLVAAGLYLVTGVGVLWRSGRRMSELPASRSPGGNVAVGGGSEEQLPPWE
jgi:MFS family permease